MFPFSKRISTNSVEHLTFTLFSNVNFFKEVNRQFASKPISKAEIRRLYNVLGVEENCEDDVLRLSFVHLAKKFHPDSGAPEASAVRFAEIESAYREIKRIRGIQKDNESKLSEVEEFDIKHTAPQHRRYLAYDVGTGTPSKRQRQYAIQRAQKAADNVMEHRLEKLQAAERNTLVGMDKQRAKDIKTRYGMDRLVEDLIQEAMNRGEFSDLPGMGKPLRSNLNIQNPYVDFVTHKLNEILIENGFTPEWIQLSKEIREETEILKKKLSEARNNFGLAPLDSEDANEWQDSVEGFRTITKKINNKIDKYNLLVPVLQKQMLHVKLESLANEALLKPPEKKSHTDTIKKSKSSSSIDSTTDSNRGLLELFTFFTGKKY